MDTNLQQAKFPTKGFILDNIVQVIGIVLPRKDIQRLIKEEKISPDKVDELIDQILDKTLSMFFTDSEKFITKKIKTALHNFFQFYTEFILTYETYKVSQKQLDYLLLKDLFIPLAADIFSVIFEENILTLREIKPTEKELPIPKLFKWIKKRVPYKNEFSQHLKKKHFDENPLDDETTMQNNLDSWEKGKNTPEIKSINMLVEYIQEDIINQNDKKIFRNLFLFARIMQKLYISLRENYEREHVDLLVEHFYLLLKFYFLEPKFSSPEDLRVYIYSTAFNRINPQIVNRDFYWDDYFLFIANVLYSNFNTRYILKEGLKRNGMLYHMNEKRAFKYMKLFLPVNVLNGTEKQNIISMLRSDLTKFVNEQKEQSFNLKDLSKWSDVLFQMSEDEEKINYLMTYLFIILQRNRSKTFQEQRECSRIFLLLENEFNISDDNPNISMLKTKYFAYLNEPKKALEYCKKCVENGKGKIGLHFQEMITEGFLLSAKCKSKNAYNLFYKHAVMINLFKYGMLKVPANTKNYSLVKVPENITNFSQLLKEHDYYFVQKFSSP